MGNRELSSPAAVLETDVTAKSRSPPRAPSTHVNPMRFPIEMISISPPTPTCEPLLDTLERHPVPNLIRLRVFPESLFRVLFEVKTLIRSPDSDSSNSSDSIRRFPYCTLTRIHFCETKTPSFDTDTDSEDIDSLCFVGETETWWGTRGPPRPKMNGQAEVCPKPVGITVTFGVPSRVFFDSMKARPNTEEAGSKSRVRRMTTPLRVFCCSGMRGDASTVTLAVKRHPYPVCQIPLRRTSKNVGLWPKGFVLEEELVVDIPIS